jgi:beta-phosphoglucomutase
LLAPAQLRVSAQLQAVVFDLDGVIVDSHPAHRLAWMEFLRTVGKQASDSELEFILDGRKREDILLHFLGPLNRTELERYGRMKDDLFRQAAREIATIPGAFDFIECLCAAGIVLAVATSASANRTHSMLNRAGLLNHFGAVITGEDVGEGKPDPGIYRLACQRIHCPPCAAVAVEDAASGVRAAKGAGLRCVGIAGGKSGEPLTAAGADCILPDFAGVTLTKFHSLVGMQPRRSGIADETP